MTRSFLSDDLMSFLRGLTGIALAAVLICLLILAGFGLTVLHNRMLPTLTCVQAHDEFHQTEGGTQVRICDKYERR